MEKNNKSYKNLRKYEAPSISVVTPYDDILVDQFVHASVLDQTGTNTIDGFKVHDSSETPDGNEHFYQNQNGDWNFDAWGGD